MMLLNKKIQCLLIVISTVFFFFAIDYYFQKENAINEVHDLNNIESKSYFDKIYLMGNTDSLQKIKLFEVEENSYYAFIPSEMRTDVYVNFEGFEELQIGDTIYRNGQELTDIYKDSPYTIFVRDTEGNALEEATLKFYFTVEIPTLYIESYSGTMESVDNDKAVKESAKIAAINADGTMDISGQCTIKARGNTAFSVDQKSYNLNFQSSQAILGLSSCSEWALLANYGRTTQQLKNKMVLDISRMLKMPYAPEAQFVNVYINNQYNGLYLLAQKISADGGSVEFADNKMRREQHTGPYLLEFDARYENEPIWFQTQHKNIVVKYPKAAHSESVEYIASYIKEVEETIFSENGVNCVTGKSYEEYIDITSWASMYLMQEFFVQWDVEFASFYLYKMADDSLVYAGPVWDFDLSCGELYPGYYPTLSQNTLWLRDNRGGWLGKLGTYPEFKTLVRQKYLGEFSAALTAYLEEEFEEQVKSLSSASYMNYKRWDRGDTKIKEDAAVLRTWIVNRKLFLDDYIDDSTEFKKISFEFGWGTMSYYLKSGEELGFIPTKEYGEIDYLENKDYGYGTIIDWQDSEGNSLSADTKIFENKEYHAIYK